jgi:DNA polymerase
VDRGRLIEATMAPFMLATVHPSSILRMPGDAERKSAFERFVADLELIREALRRAPQ